MDEEPRLAAGREQPLGDLRQQVIALGQALMAERGDGDGARAAAPAQRAVRAIGKGRTPTGRSSALAKAAELIGWNVAR